MKTYVCRKQMLYYYLTKKGFKPFKTCPDMYNAERIVWLYTSTPELRDTVEMYYKEMPARIATEQNQ